MSKPGGILARVSSLPPIPNRGLIVVTRRGNLPAVGCESVSTNEWTIQLKHGELLRRFKLCVTERVLLACDRNPYAGAEIMRILLRSYPGQVPVDVLRASAENFACGVPLLKLLLQRGEYTGIPAEVFQAACANGSCGHEILDFLDDGNYSFTISEAALLACSRNGPSTRAFMV
jgi:hypothetical protein